MVLDLYGEAAKFQTKLIEIIEVDLTVHLIETIIDMQISLRFHATSMVVSKANSYTRCLLIGLL